MFSEIAEIKSIREQKSKLLEREKELTEPILTDLGMIETLYTWFKDVFQDLNLPGEVNSVSNRNKFIYIILYLYSPDTLAGRKMKNGLRSKLSEVLKVNAGTVISDNRNDSVFSYHLYKYFRKDVEKIYEEMMKRVESAE